MTPEEFKQFLNDDSIIERMPKIVEAVLDICALKEKGYDRFIELIKETLKETKPEEKVRREALETTIPLAEALKKARAILAPAALSYVNIARKNMPLIKDIMRANMEQRN